MVLLSLVNITSPISLEQGNFRMWIMNTCSCSYIVLLHNTLVYLRLLKRAQKKEEKSVLRQKVWKVLDLAEHLLYHFWDSSFCINIETEWARHSSVRLEFDLKPREFGSNKKNSYWQRQLQFLIKDKYLIWKKEAMDLASIVADEITSRKSGLRRWIYQIQSKQ